MRQSIVKVEGRPDLVRDMGTGAIMVSDDKEYQNFMMKRKEMNDIKVRMAVVENGINNIQILLEKLLEGRDA